LSDLSSGRDIGGEGGLNGVCEGREHRVGCRVGERDEKIGVLGGAVFLGVGEDVGSVRGRLQSWRGTRICMSGSVL
jgi:hypothetical protein